MGMKWHKGDRVLQISSNNNKNGLEPKSNAAEREMEQKCNLIFLLFAGHYNVSNV
jgi:hypothetical protein